MKSAFALIGISTFSVLLIDVNPHIIAVVFCLLFLALNLLGVREAGRVHRRFGTPWNALLLTGALVLVSLFLRLGILIEAASMVIILMQILANISVIILRESRLQNYKPRFHAPFYPWLQIVGIIGLALLIVEAGLESSLAAIAQIVHEDGFERRWLAAKGEQSLRDLVLLGKRRR